VLYRAKRQQDKTIRRNIARHIIPGSGRRYHKAVSEMTSSVVTIQCYARMYMARRKVSSMRGGVYRRRNTNGTRRSCKDNNIEDYQYTHTPVIPPVPSYTVPGTRRIHSQASGFSQSSLRITLRNYESFPKDVGENGEREYDAKYDAGDTCANVFAFSAFAGNQGPPLLPNVYYTWGEEPNIELPIKLDGEFVGKVEVDRGAWGEYDDNPDNVKDWKRIMNEVRKFTDCAFVWYDVASGDLLRSDHEEPRRRGAYIARVDRLRIFGKNGAAISYRYWSSLCWNNKYTKAEVVISRLILKLLSVMTWIYGYCWKVKGATIRMRNGMPDFSDLEVAKADCDEMVHVECNTSISVIGNTLDGYTLVSSDIMPNISDNKSIEGGLKSMSDNAGTVLPSSATPTFTDATLTITYTDSENNSSTIIEDQNRINIGSTNIIHFEEEKVGNHHEVKFDSLEHMSLEKMGSNCLRTWNLERSYMSPWGAQKVYRNKVKQLVCNHYELDGRGVTDSMSELDRNDTFRIWRYASKLVYRIT